LKEDKKGYTKASMIKVLDKLELDRGQEGDGSNMVNDEKLLLSNVRLDVREKFISNVHERLCGEPMISWIMGWLRLIETDSCI
jgi:hypothetical protein